MKAFFDREAQRLDFTTLRMDKRAKEKKALDTAKAEAIATVGHSNTTCIMYLCLKIINHSFVPRLLLGTYPGILDIKCVFVWKLLH